MHINYENQKPTRYTGTALKEQWIPATTRCTVGAADTATNVSYSKDKNDLGNAHTSAEIIKASGTELSLIKLNTPHELTAYPA
ncbi:hypothetical protein [Rothia sp. ZJ932]|uniref:hypothetical protein n=1 Tax=Rothia sp. ZJ932 TaxID=2810516 RepID=UPI001968468E|nr:hypothetical protein [Rothia sp. ZJ932]QRZ61340.1 hypothetical protein JR346_08910 [Rothia sp. ZJ932]